MTSRILQCFLEPKPSVDARDVLGMFFLLCIIFCLSFTTPDCRSIVISLFWEVFALADCLGLSGIIAGNPYTGEESWLVNP